MIEFGCLAHFCHLYTEDVLFARENGFCILQIWYDKDGVSLQKESNKLDVIINSNFPSIIHAVLDINEYEEHIPKLIAILKELNHKELIIHPVCKSESINSNTIQKLSRNIKYSYNQLRKNGIKLYVENNSKLDVMLNSVSDIHVLFSENPDVEMLLDVAHIDNYKHLEEIIKIKYPKILHLADRHMELIHEHLPVGKGNIDFSLIFNKILSDYDGRIILEITQSNEELISSKKIISSIIDERKRTTTVST
jgi:sugar phosphate isomerase/epimerase